MFEFNYEKCLKYKKQFGKNRNFSLIWRNNFAQSNKIGNCTNLYRKILPVSYEDFYKRYIEYAENNKLSPIKDRGLTYDELISLASDYKSMCEKTCNCNFNIECYFYEAVSHIIIETFDGQYQERVFREYLTKKGYKCECFEGNFDGKYGVDIKIINNSKIFGLQIKPLTFFLSTRDDVVQDQKNLCYKYEKLLHDYNIKTFYAIYVRDKDNNIKWLKNKNGFKFKIEELFDYDPNNIFKTVRMKKFEYTIEDLI